MELEGIAEIEVELKEAGPQGEPGLSAYDIYLKNGGTMTETEWLDSLNGYAPVRGIDYWTEEDVSMILIECDKHISTQLGIINQELATLADLGGSE